MSIGGLAVVGAVAAPWHCRFEDKDAALGDGLDRSLAEPSERWLGMSLGAASYGLRDVVDDNVNSLLRYGHVLRRNCNDIMNTGTRAPVCHS